MPTIDAAVFMCWRPDANDNNVPDAVDEVFAWALANGERLPNSIFAATFEDITGMNDVRQHILNNRPIFVAKLELTPTTAAHFASDPRFWTLGYRRLNDEGEVTFSNWDNALSAANRQAAIALITGNSDFTVEQIAAAFSATDKRRDIARKLRAFFKRE